MSFKNMIASSVLIILFIFLTIFFAINLGGEYGRDTSELSGDKFNYSGVQDTINVAHNTSEEWKTAFSEQSNLVITGIVAVDTFFNIGKLMYNFIIAPIVIINGILVGVLHVPQEAINIGVFMVIVIGLVIGLWSLIKFFTK